MPAGIGRRPIGITPLLGHVCIYVYIYIHMQIQSHLYVPLNLQVSPKLNGGSRGLAQGEKSQAWWGWGHSRIVEA